MNLTIDIVDGLTKYQQTALAEVIQDDEDVSSMHINDATGLGDFSIRVEIERTDRKSFIYYIEQDGELTFNTGE